MGAGVPHPPTNAFPNSTPANTQPQPEPVSPEPSVSAQPSPPSSLQHSSTDAAATGESSSS